MHEFNIDQVKYRIRLFVGVVIVAFVCISAWSIIAERNDVISSAERHLEAYARALAEHSESAFAESDRVLRDLLHDTKVSGGIGKLEPQELFLELKRQVADSPQIGALFLVDKNGSMFANSQEFPFKQIQVSDRPYFRHYLTTPGADLTISTPVVSRLTNRWRFNLIRPLNRPGEPFAGLAAVAFEVGYFKRMFSTGSLGPGGRVMLVRDDGAPLVYEPYVKGAYEKDFRKSKLFREMLPASPFGTFHSNKSECDATARIVSYQRLGRFPVISVVSLSRDDVLAPWRHKALRQSALTIAVCLVLVYLARLILRHLDRLKLALVTVEGQQEQLQVKAAQIDAANDAILQIDAQGRLIHFNQALCQMTGYRADQLVGRGLHQIVDPSFIHQITPNIELLREGRPVTYESAYLSSSGTVVPVEVHALAMSSGSRPLILNIARDITQRKLSEQRENSRLKILEAMATGGSLEDLLVYIVRFVEQESPGALCSVLLFDESQSRLRHGAAPSLPDFYNKAVDGLTVRKGAGSCGTAAFQRSRVVVEDIEDHPYWKGFEPVREAGLRSCWSEPILASDGRLLGTFALYHREPRTPTAEEFALIESATHLASLAIERAQGDENRKHLEEQLRHVQKIEAIGQLAAGVAHDFNNLLTPILVYAGLLKKDFRQDDIQMKKVDGIVSAANKAKDLTQKLLSFGRKQMLNKEVLDLNEVVLSLKEIITRTVRENIALEMRLLPGSAEISADRGQIEQILINLAVNAQDAIFGNGTLLLKTDRLFLDEEFVKSRSGLQPGSHCVLTVTDNGCGMSEDTMQRIFEPFFTTKSVGEGTGLGLATVYGIVKQHEGYIEVQSRLGEGTTFIIYLRAASGVPKPVSAPAAVPQKVGGAPGQTVMVVEDNEMVREMAVELLNTCGYRVLVAEDPLRAQEIVKSELGVIDLLVTDVVMPHMNGPELYAKLVQLRPGLPVVYMSGYADNLVTRDLVLGSSDDFLRKPFSAERFLDCIGKKLHARR